MASLTVGQSLEAALAPLTVETELIGEDGKVLGYFVPLAEAEARAYQVARSSFDPEVIRQRGLHQGPWLTTAEVIERLESTE